MGELGEVQEGPRIGRVLAENGAGDGIREDGGWRMEMGGWRMERRELGFREDGVGDRFRDLLVSHFRVVISDFCL